MDCRRQDGGVVIPRSRTTSCLPLGGRCLRGIAAQTVGVGNRSPHCAALNSPPLTLRRSFKGDAATRRQGRFPFILVLRENPAGQGRWHPQSKTPIGDPMGVCVAKRQPPAKREGKGAEALQRKTSNDTMEAATNRRQRSKEDSKMSELSLTHCKHECKYHVVFAPKFCVGLQ